MGTPARLFRAALIMAAVITPACTRAPSWPPRTGERYPDVEAIDASGRAVRRSSFKGQVLIIEPIGMSNPVSLARSAGGIPLEDPRAVHIQLLLFNPQMMPTTADDARWWTAHFHKGKANPPIVLAGGPWFLQPDRSQASYKLIPRIQRVDKDFVLRSDSAGDTP